MRISYVREGRGAAPPVVLHHGFGANRLMNWVMPGIVDAFVASGRVVISLDARGHGESDKPHDAQRYGETRMAQDLRELLAHLDVASFDLFGYSMGAVVSLLVAADGAPVRRLVVGGVGEGVLISGGVDLRVMDRDAVVAALLAPDATAIPTPGAAAFRLFAERSGADLRALAAQAARMHDTPIDLACIAAPTLVLAGMDDMLARDPQRLAAALPDACCVMVPGDHLGAVRQPMFTASAVEFFNA